jgi:hypothetical protein
MDDAHKDPLPLSQLEDWLAENASRYLGGDGEVDWDSDDPEYEDALNFSGSDELYLAACRRFGISTEVEDEEFSARFYSWLDTHT